MYKIAKNNFIHCLALAFVVNIIIELLGRNPISSIIGHITAFPTYFLLNWLIVGLSLCLSLFFKRKHFVMLILSFLWLALGGLNAYVLSYRVTPLSAIDFFILQISWDFIGLYLSIAQLLLIVAGVILAAIGLTFIYRRCPQSPVKIGRAIVYTLCTAGAAALMLSCSYLFGISEEHLSDMRSACDKYGFVYCFLRGSVERGIEEPEPEAKEALADSLKEMEEDIPKQPKVEPNIIMLQLESFFDVNKLNSVEFSENPIPFFTKLQENYSSGQLSMPSIGAGTANSEFEVISGMNLDFFGSGEYPYKTVLKSETCETTAYNLIEMGYSTAAIHSNNATFYDRSEVFPRLGFQRFISSEYMTGVLRNSQGWIKDRYLIPQIMDCLKLTDTRDYIYTISVQGHGAYPGEKQENPAVSIEKSSFEPQLEAQMEYFANQLRETDDFLKELTGILSRYQEPVVLVLFGDHLPSLNIKQEELSSGDLFQTPYVIWSNYRLERKEKDLEAYQLSAYTMDRLGIHQGVITKLHQEYNGEADYLDQLKSLEYDMLYGEKLSLNGKAYEPADMKMGLRTIEISNVSPISGGLKVKGKNFTANSVIAVNGTQLKSSLAAPGHLWAQGDELKNGDVVTVLQVSDDSVVLSSTSPYFVSGLDRPKE